MINPIFFRRLNPSHPVSTPKSEDKDILRDWKSQKSDKSKSSLNKEREYYTAVIWL